MRIEQLSARTGVPVDTVRYYQSRGLLEPPRRQGRVVWYGRPHVERLARIRDLQRRGFTLATIARLISGELDAADEALVSELSGLRRTDADGVAGVRSLEGGRGGAGTGYEEQPPVRTEDPAGAGPVLGDESCGPVYTLAELAEETGVPLALLKAVEAEGFLVPRRVEGRDRYTGEDVAAARAGLLLLEWGVPLGALLDLARRHHEATSAVAEEAVGLFSTHVRGSLRSAGTDAPSQVERLLQAYSELLPAVATLVGHHFVRTLLKAALEHVERVAPADERRAVQSLVGTLDASDETSESRSDLPPPGRRQ